MKGQPVDQLVFEHMFPKPKPTEPQNFHAFLQRSLIPEVRQETHAFYGHLDTQEAKYPGLDYAHPTHRLRLGRWPWHRRLFRAFDNLGLTPAEIAALTKWEGTRWAKEKYEAEQGIHIRDTAGDSLQEWVEPTMIDETPVGRQRRAWVRMQHHREQQQRQQQQQQHEQRELQRQQDILRGHEEQRRHNQRVGEYLEQQRLRQQQQQQQQQQQLLLQLQQQQQQQLLLSPPPQQQQLDPNTAILRHRLESDENMDSDDELESVGVELNNRLRAQAARREAGESSVVLDEEWEQWLKTAIEAGVLEERMSEILERSLAARMTENLTEAMTESMTDSMTEGVMDSMSMTEGSRIPASVISQGMLNLARADRWSGIPENLHPALRRALDAERAPIPDGHDSHERPETSATRSTLQPAETPRDRDTERDMQRMRERERNMNRGIAWDRTSGATSRRGMAWTRGPYTPIADAVAAVADIL